MRPPTERINMPISMNTAAFTLAGSLLTFAGLALSGALKEISEADDTIKTLGQMNKYLVGKLVESEVPVDDFDDIVMSFYQRELDN